MFQNEPSLALSMLTVYIRMATLGEARDGKVLKKRVILQSRIGRPNFYASEMITSSAGMLQGLKFWGGG